MESDKKYIDISFAKTQNKVALRLADVFTIEELESIDLNDAIIPEKRDISGMLIPIYIKSFKYGMKDNKVIIILDSIIEDTFPIQRFHSINVYKGAYGVEIKCIHRENNLDYLAICIAIAINYLKYGKKDKRIISRNAINNSFSKKSLIISSQKTLKEVLFILEYLNVNNAFVVRNNYSYVFYIDNIQIKIDSYYTSCIKFSISDEKEESHIYIVKNKIDISNLFMIIESAI